MDAKQVATYLILTETVPASNTAQRFDQYDRTVSQFSSDTTQEYTVAFFDSLPRQIIYP